MSGGNVEVVRQRITVRAHARRGLDQRLALWFPRALAGVARLVWRLPPRSRLRRAIVRRAVRVTFEAVHRRDYPAAFALYREDGESVFPPELATVGEGARTRGRSDRIDYQRRWDTDWGEFRNELEEVIDLGDRILVLGRFVGSGMSSGATFDREGAYLVTVSAGLAIREQIFLSHADALEAAGLRE